MAVFRWDERAQMFAGDVVIARPSPSPENAFAHISARQTHDVASQLGAALVGSRSFCITDQSQTAKLHADEGCFLTLTGGSSGQPKVILRTQASWIASFLVNSERFSMGPDDSVAVFGRLNHSLALYGVLEALHLGLNAHVCDGMRPRPQRAMLAQNAVNILYATPTQLRLLTQHAEGETLPAVRLVLCGGGSLDASTHDAMQALCPDAAIHVFYGSAETSFTTLSDKATPAGSVGAAYPGATLRILDPNGVPTSDVGEVWVQSPYLFETYVSDGSAHTKWQDGFVTVGEMGQMDPDGNLWLKGRTTRMVTIADQNVFPEVVEALIATHPQAGPCAVLALPDKLRGNRLVAVVQGLPDCVTADTVKEMCRAKLGAVMTPFKVLFHPSLPVSTSGKVDMATLTTWAKEQP